MAKREILENKANEIKNWDKKRIEELYILLIEMQYLVDADNEKRGWNGKIIKMKDFIDINENLPTAGDSKQNYDILAIDEKNDCLVGRGYWMKNYHIKSLKSLS